MTARVLIVDDEQPARDLLRRYVEERGDLELAAEASSGEEAVAAAGKLAPDLMLLDVEMPELDGFGVLAELERGRLDLPWVIFVTAFERYAVRAFEAQALDYLLKPVTRRRFDRAIDRYLALADPPAPSVQQLLEDALVQPPQRVLVRTLGRIVPVPVEAIDWVEANGDYVNIHVGGRRHLIERTLTDMEKLLAPRSFLRVHRGALVNQNRIRELRPLGSGRYRLLLTDGSELVVSRTYSSRFRGDLL